MTELGEGFSRSGLRSGSAAPPQSVRFDLNPYALQALSDIRPRPHVFPAASGGRQWAKYDAD